MDCLTCENCFEKFDEGYRCPRVLSCGHSFCHSCLDNLLVQSPRCPTCKTIIFFTKTEFIPVNFTLKSLVNITSEIIMRTISTVNKPKIRDSVSVTSASSLDNSSADNMCLRILCCGVCFESFNEDSRSPRVLKCGHSICHSCLEELSTRSLQSCPYCFSFIHFSNTESIPSNKLLKRLISSRPDMPNDAISTLIVPKSIEELNLLCQNGSIYAVEDALDGARYGKVEVKEGRIWVSNFEIKKQPKAGLISFKELLCQFSETSDHLQTVFFKLTTKRARVELEGNYRYNAVDVVIKTDGKSWRSKNFILLCSGLKNSTYMGLAMNGCSSSYGILPAPPPVKHIDVNETDNKTPFEKGGVYGMNERDSWFTISLRDRPLISYPQIGEVIAGLHILQKQARNCYVMDCGVVI